MPKLQGLTLRSAGDGLPALMMADYKGDEKMKLIEFKKKMLGIAIGQAKLLAEMSVLEDKKIEPEQLRKNVATILSILVETEDFLNKLENTCSNSDN